MHHPPDQRLKAAMQCVAHSSDQRRKSLAPLRAKDLLYADTLASETWLSLLMVALAVWLALPFEVYGGAIGRLSVYLTEPVCGLWLGALGCLRLYSIRYSRYVARQWFAFFSLFAWSYLFWITVGNQWKSAGTPIFLWLMCQSYWVFLRMSDHSGEK